jgi:hypothetical protein
MSPITANPDVSRRRTAGFSPLNAVPIRSIRQSPVMAKTYILVIKDRSSIPTLPTQLKDQASGGEERPRPFSKIPISKETAQVMAYARR